MESFRFSAAMRWICFTLFVLQLEFTNADEDCPSITRPMLDDLCGINQLEVSYANENLECGKEIPLSQISTKPAPTVKFSNADSEKTYALLMIDPDAPNSGSNYWLHWLNVNIKGQDLKSGSANLGKQLTEYKAPSPPAGTGKHRYQFFLLEQSQDTSAEGPAQRGQFNAVDFANNNKFCAPVAATFQFRTERSG